MPDEIDIANDMTQTLTDAVIQQQRQKASQIPQGKPGECDMCGEWSGRLVNGVCAPCRDSFDILPSLKQGDSY